MVSKLSSKYQIIAVVRPIRTHNLDFNDQIDSRLNQSEQLERYLVQLTQEKTNNMFSI